MLHVVYKSIVSRPVRNGTLLICYAIIAASLFSGNYVMGGASESVKSGIAKLGADLIVVPEEYAGKGEAVILRGEPSTFFFSRDIVPEIEGTAGVKQVAPEFYIATLDTACCYLPVQLITFDATRDFTITPWVRKNTQRPLKQDDIIVGNLIVPDVGATLKFYGHKFTIAGKLEPTGTGLDTSIFIQQDDGYTMAAESGAKAVKAIDIPRSGASAVLVRVDDPSRVQEVADRISSQVPGTKVLTPTLLISKVTGELGSLTQILLLTAFVATLVSLPLIALISIMATSERIRELGVLRALGATKMNIFLLVFGESILLSATGGLLGLFVSQALLVLFQELIESLVQIPLTIPNAVVLTGISLQALLLTIFAGGVSALYPAYRSAAMEPYSAIRSGEL